MKLKGKKILLVEDDDFMADLVIMHLQKAGMEYVWAKDGSEGLSEIKKNKFDLILTDLLMKGMDGVEMIKELQSDEKNKHIPVLVLTNRTDDDIEVQQASNLGVEGFFTKSSTSFSDLIARIAIILKVE